MTRTQLDQIIALVNDRIGDEGFECIEAEWSIEDDPTLRLFVDRLGKPGFNLTDCMRVNELLDDSSDIDSMIPGQYNLEVSSPGVERPLRRKSHFESCIGQFIQVKLGEKVLNRSFGKGRLVEVSQDGEVTLETSRGKWSFPIASLKQASVVYKWNDKQGLIN